MKQSFKFIYVLAIIVVIVIVVTLGLFVMKSSQSFIESADISISDTNEFNNKWIVYKGKQKGSDVRMLMQKVVSNVKENSDKPSMLLDIAYQIHDQDEFIVINSTKKDPSISELEKIGPELDVKHYYIVEMVYSKHKKVVTGIIIKYSDNSSFEFEPDEN